jgi:PEP-CTERM motif
LALAGLFRLGVTVAWPDSHRAEVSMRRLFLVLFASLLVAALPAFANTVSVNGVCLQGTCGSPDILLPGQTTAGTFSGGYTFGNGDMYSITGSWDNYLTSDGLGIEIFPKATVTFLGSSTGGPAVGTDFMDMPFVQGYQVAFSSGVFSDGIFGTTTGSFGAGSMITFLANINGTPLSGSGPLALPGNFYYYNPNNPVNGISNPLILTFEYQINFGQGTLPGATVYIDEAVPEPSSLALFASGLIGGLAAIRKKLT